MKCPKCGTNINGVNDSCPICGYIPPVSTDNKQEIKNDHKAIGIIDKRDFFNTNRNNDEYKIPQSKNNMLPIIIIFGLIAIVILLIFAMKSLF